jgi:hypothetical protein
VLPEFASWDPPDRVKKSLIKIQFRLNLYNPPEWMKEPIIPAKLSEKDDGGNIFLQLSVEVR